MKVILSHVARRDIRAIYKWIQERSSVGAERWLAAFNVVASGLAQTAKDCPYAEEADRLGIAIQYRIFKTHRGLPYRLLFLVDNNVIQILAIRGSGQDWLRPDEIELAE